MKKPSNCKCEGNVSLKKLRWRRLYGQSDSRKSYQLKCLKCGWKWYSRTKYSKDLPIHKEDSRRGMTDWDILDRINELSLVVCTFGSWVMSNTTRGTAWLKIIERHSNGSAYRFVEICRNGKKKKIALHRLVWMSGMRELVPSGFDVDHVNGKNGLYPDRFENLELVPSSYNRSKGKPEEF